MLTWQKRLRATLAILIVVVAALVFFALRPRPSRDKTDAPPARIDKRATVEAQGRGVYTRTVEGRTVFTLTFAQQLAYPDGRTDLKGVELVLPNRDGRTFRVKAPGARRSAEAGRELGAVTFDGGVEMTGDDGLRVETASASYDEKARLVRAPSKVTFSRGRVSGSGNGATYDEAQDTLSLLDQAHIVVAADQTGQGAMTIDAARAALARRDRRVRLEGSVTVKGSPQSASAETADVLLTPEDLTDRVELTGRASVTGDGTGPFRAMRGESIVLDYGADGRTLERATLTGAASAELSAAAGSRTLSGNSIDAGLGPTGQTVKALTASGNVELSLPAEGATMARTVRSATLNGRGDDKGINTLTFAGGVDFRELPATKAGAKPPTPRIATSETLDVTLEPGFGAIKDARFRGSVVFRDGGVRADAPDARYAIDRGLLQLSSAPTAPMPRVVDERVSVDARAIDLTTGSKRLQAKGDVRSVLQPQNPSAQDRRMPAMLERDKPVNVTAAALAYDGDAGLATYTGKARLWQGETSIQGETLVLDDKRGHLTGKGGVLSRLMLEEKTKKSPAEGAPTETTPKGRITETLARGDTLAYDNTARRAIYDGHAHLTGPEGDVSGDRIELFLDESGRALERAEAYGTVSATFEGGHRATGARLTYLAETDRYSMSGTPVRIFEKVSDGCRETAGAALTFSRSTDTIAVVGNEGSRSRTTPGSCAEPPR